jgi:1A family penicillin-binding protein
VPNSSTESGQEDKLPISSRVNFSKGIFKIAGETTLSMTVLGTSAFIGLTIGLAISFRNLPNVRTLKDFIPSETSFIYDINGKLISSLHGEANRNVVKLDQISPNLKRAVIAIEDSNFYYHHGINLNSIGRALLANVYHGGVVEGGSTLTMQLVKNIYLSQRRTVDRKLVEAVLAVRIEQVFSKDDILKMYLNTIYWGHNNYGAETASQTYFGKSASQLTLAEGALMAGLIQAPEDYSPLVSLVAAKKRQAAVLNRMEELGWISPEEKQIALAQTLKFGRKSAWIQSKLPYVTDAVIQELNHRFGKEVVKNGGLRIQTTVDFDTQKLAQDTMQNARQSLINQGINTKDLQIALASVDPRTHFIKAVVGGYDYQKSQLNRALDSRRPPGSTFKPFVYYTAFASGKYTPDSEINDAPIHFGEGNGYYSPKNYGGRYSGEVSLRTALINSINIPAVILGRRVGLDKVIEICKSIGINSPLIPTPSLSLGAIGVTPMEMAGAYAAFASNGWYSEPTILAKVTDSRGNVILDNTSPHPQLVLNQWAAATLTSVLRAVVSQGTGREANIGRQVAGKTGTTDSERNIWFVGYVPQLATAIWIGDDNNRPLGDGVTGGGDVAPIWANFMSKVLKNEPEEYFEDPSNFKAPKGD